MLALQDRAQDLRAQHPAVVAARAQPAASPSPGAAFAAGLARVPAAVRAVRQGVALLRKQLAAYHV